MKTKTKNQTKNQYKSLNINIPIKEHIKMNKLIEEGNYLNTSDFCRTAIRNEIRKHEEYK